MCRKAHETLFFMAIVGVEISASLKDQRILFFARAKLFWIPRELTPFAMRFYGIKRKSFQWLSLAFRKETEGKLRWILLNFKTLNRKDFNKLSC